MNSFVARALAVMLSMMDCSVLDEDDGADVDNADMAEGISVGGTSKLEDRFRRGLPLPVMLSISLSIL
jgi:hypothetical protein